MTLSPAQPAEEERYIATFVEDATTNLKQSKLSSSQREESLPRVPLREVSFLLVKSLFSSVSSQPRASASHSHPMHSDGSYGWLVERIASGEAVAVLSLAGNTVAGPQLADGQRCSYTLRKREGETTVCISQPFAYVVRATCGPVVDGGRVVLFERAREAEGNTQPLSGQLKARDSGYQAGLPTKTHEVVLAFRGVRPAATGDAVLDAGPSSDRAAFRDFKQVAVRWLPARLREQVRVHRGALEQHDALWPALKVALNNLVLHELIGERCELLFAGLSLGGAVAQLTAWRVALEFPGMHTFVLTYGAVAWGNRAACSAFDETFGRRAVQLVLMEI